jgi:surface polysaccharide O-acyltransferase-like enzyme
MKISSTTTLSNDSTLQSKVIDFLRFPLIVGVLFIHNGSATVSISGEELGNSGYMPLHHFCSDLFSQILGRVAVPLFFFISGFLFFLKTPYLGKKEYFQKLRARTKTLLIPYLFWNLLYLAFLFLAFSIPALGLSKWINRMSEITAFDFQYMLTSLWGLPSRGMYPIVYQFWFIRDLMVVVVLSPIIYLFVKKAKIYGIFLLGVLWFFNCGFVITGISSVAIFFFTAGAWFGINKQNMVEQMGHIKSLSFIVYPVLVVADLLTKEYMLVNPYVHKMGIVFGVIFLFNLSSFLLYTNKITVNKFLSTASFFVFAVHEMWLLSPIRKVVFVVLKPSTDVELAILYFVNVIIVISIALLLYYLLRKFLPRFTKIITGGR